MSPKKKPKDTGEYYPGGYPGTTPSSQNNPIMSSYPGQNTSAPAHQTGAYPPGPGAGYPPNTVSAGNPATSAGCPAPSAVYPNTTGGGSGYPAQQPAGYPPNTGYPPQINTAPAPYSTGSNPSGFFAGYPPTTSNPPGAYPNPGQGLMASGNPTGAYPNLGQHATAPTLTSSLPYHPVDPGKNTIPTPDQSGNPPQGWNINN